MIERVGGRKAIEVDTRIICATHRNLREMIEQKAFREDLYYRLNGLAVRLPPLRERSDLMALVERILDRESPERRLRLSPEVVRLFQGYHWPGNVRQLFNVLRTACVMASGESLITRDHLSDDFIDDARLVAQQRAASAEPVAAPVFVAPTGPAQAAAVPMPPAAAPVEPVSPAASMPAPVAARLPDEPAMSLEDIELRTIQQAVDAAGGNISVAAKRLGISRNTLYRRLKQAPD